jgi:hypothetical protein
MPSTELPVPPPPSPVTSPIGVELLSYPQIYGEIVQYHDYKKGRGGFSDRSTIYLTETILLTTYAKDNGGNWVYWGETKTVSTWNPFTGVKTTQPPQVTGNGGLEAGLLGGFITQSDTLRIIPEGNGLNGVKSTYTDTLSDPYTTEMLTSYVESRVPAFRGRFEVGGDWAYIYLDPGGMAYDVYKLQYKWHVNPDLTHAVVWDETFTPYDANGDWNPGPNGENIKHNILSWTPETATDSPVHSIDPTQQNGKHNGYYEEDLLALELMVDGNTDGEMSFDIASVHDKDRTTPGKPYQFWVNDDSDGILDGEEVEAGSPDYADIYLKSLRDLEDFSRLWISFKGLTQMVKNGGVTVQLEWKPMDGGTSWPGDAGNPAINVFKAVETDGGNQYLSDEATAKSQVSYGNTPTEYSISLGRVGRGQPLVLPATLFSTLSESQPNNFLLFEGAGEGKSEYRIRVSGDEPRREEGPAHPAGAGCEEGTETPAEKIAVAARLLSRFAMRESDAARVPFSLP